jgi:hypothetical protein
MADLKNRWMSIGKRELLAMDGLSIEQKEPRH